MLKTSKGKRARMWTWFFSPTPFSGIGKFEDLPYLKENHAIAALSIGVVGIIVATWDILRVVDPWAQVFFKHGELALDYFIAVFVLIFITAIITWKQLSYYFGEHGRGKQGIFKKSIKQVNPLEMTSDVLLAIVGGLIFFFAALPILWFFMLFIYSILVIFRCAFTLLRKTFARKLRNEGESIPPWYDESLEYEHNGLVVKHVLMGWIISHSICAISSLVLFGFFLYPHFRNLCIQFRTVAFFTAIGGIIIPYLGLSGPAYLLGKKIYSKKQGPASCTLVLFS